MAHPSPEYEPVYIPAPREPGRPGRPPGAFKARQDLLFKVLRDPPSDFDGSNAKMAQHMGLSVRHVSRILSALEATGRIQIRFDRVQRAGHWVNQRCIEILKES